MSAKPKRSGSLQIRSSEITPEPIYRERRAFVKSAFALTGSMVTPLAWSRTDEIEGLTPKLEWPVVESHEMAGGEAATHWSYLTTYNNYYEFGEDKDDAVKRSQDLRTRPWTLEISGECESPGILDFDTLMRAMQVEERIYRLRCIERWSMVVPWNGFELASLLKLARPTSRAKFVEFTSLADPEQMPGVRPRAAIEWPYTEGLRIDEAMHPLTLMAVGVYGRELPNQNGAPIRLVVPWKYGFKSIKAIVRIRFVEQQPATSWNTANPREHGFYSNVNPNVRHPRWSQKAEKRIGDWFKRPTLMFNGYADQVGSLYAGMDLQKYR